jgi:hypothetical protein
MSSIDNSGEQIDWLSRKGESVTDFSDWDNEIIEWDSSTGIYYVAGKPVSMCQGVAMFKPEEVNNHDQTK